MVFKPIALPLISLGNLSLKIATVVPEIMAADTPWINLSINKLRKSLLRIIPMEDKAKTETPIKKIFSLSAQSLILPITRTVDARAIRNEFRTQFISARETWNSSDIMGRAILIEDEVNGVRKEARVVVNKTP